MNRFHQIFSFQTRAEKQLLKIQSNCGRIIKRINLKIENFEKHYSTISYSTKSF